MARRDQQPCHGYGNFELMRKRRVFRPRYWQDLGCWHRLESLVGHFDTSCTFDAPALIWPANFALLNNRASNEGSQNLHTNPADAPVCFLEQ